MAKNQNIDELFEEQTMSTSSADETAKSIKSIKSIEVKSKGFYCKNGYVNVIVDNDDLSKFQKFVGHDNWKTFSIARDCLLVEEQDFNRFMSKTWTVYMSKPNENGEAFPFGYNEELQRLNSLPQRHAILAASVK